MPTRTDEISATASLAAYQQSTQRARDQLERAVTAIWRSLGTYRNAQMATFVHQFLPWLQGAEQHMVSLTSGYLADQRRYATGTTTRLIVPPLTITTGSATRNGTEPAEVYERPFHQVWRDLHDQVEPGEAIDQGRKTAVNLAVTDLQRSKTLASQQILTDDEDVSGYRRVLEGDSSCGLCIVASTQRYHRGELLPLHPGCDCGVLQTFGEDEQLIEPRRLVDVHQAIEDTFGASSPAARHIPGAYADGKPINYRDVLIVHKHGELGPVLAVRGHDWTGPSDLS
jgi:hypothetical protein